MGANASQLEKEFGASFPSNERFFGLTNFGNTCYCNSVLQALFFCVPFREKVLECRTLASGSSIVGSGSLLRKKENLLSCLVDLFTALTSQKKRVGVYSPKKFVSRLKKENEVFDNFQQQDAHEFFNYLLNTIADLIKEREKGKEKDDKTKSWVHEIFEGVLTNETRCLTCETVSSKEESFLDLSVDIEQHTSITTCLKCFSQTETLREQYKYFCDACCSKQEATKRMRIKRLPQVLALHLKRFKYLEAAQRFHKLSYRVVFPMELKLFNTDQPDHLYTLFAVVIHCGSGPNRGHYITIVKSHGFWLLFDDDIVEKIEPHVISEFFGVSSENPKSSEASYILFYESCPS